MNHLVVDDSDNHRFSFALGEQVVHDEIDATIVHPVRRKFARASHEVEDRVSLVGVILRREVYVHIAHAISNCTIVELTSYGAMRHVRLSVVPLRSIAVNDKFAIRRHSGESCVCIIRVGH